MLPYKISIASFGMIFVLMTTVACEQFCYFGQGLNSTSDSYLSISSFRLGSLCVIAMQANGFWAANSVEKAKSTVLGFWGTNRKHLSIGTNVAPESCSFDLNLNTYFCFCSTHFCNNEQLLYEKWPAIKENQTMFLPQEISSSDSSLKCFECGTIKLFSNVHVIPCDGSKICKGTACVREPKTNSRAYCKTSWNKVTEMGCEFDKEAGYELCTCHTNLCNIQNPEIAQNIDKLLKTPLGPATTAASSPFKNTKTQAAISLLQATTSDARIAINPVNLLPSSNKTSLATTTSPLPTARRLLRQESGTPIPFTTTTSFPVTACPICLTTNPCKNNGTFVVTGPDTFVCACPDRTTGANCSTILTCEAGECGSNATCTVFNHKKVCACSPGYTGDPHVACNIRTKKACMTGDPHYTTFDGTRFDYMGTCPYYAMKACKSDDFSIIATNTFSNPNKTVSMVTEFVLKTQGHEFRVDSTFNYYIDGIRTYFPNYWPSAADPKIVATKPAEKVIIQDNKSGAVIEFAAAYLCTEVPLNDLFFGNDKMCGIWGSINDVCTDDVQDKNGKQFAVPANYSLLRTNVESLRYMDSWVVDSTVNNCVEDSVIFTESSNCDLQAAQTQCDLIRQAMNSQGPFAACNVMGNDAIDKSFHDCTYDVCHSHPLCNALETFAHLCNSFPFTNIDNWRDISKCPYTCPPHSHYSMKTPKCQNSCADQNYSMSVSCKDGYEEGCKCDPNYYFDSNGQHDGFSFACRLLDECGCVDGNGNYYPPHHHWLNENCTFETQCNNGKITSGPVKCSSDALCNIVNGLSTCQCESGYNGNGYACTDIIECEDGSMCGVDTGKGKCSNSIGGFNCTCYSPYSGSKCEKYTPSRHCADLQLFHGITQNGTYSISIGANYTLNVTDDELLWTKVFCDMESNGGGWTLMSHGSGSAAVKQFNCGRTFREYARGFGDPSSLMVWLGLENIHTMTETPTSLRIIIEECPTETTPAIQEECTYPYFHVSDTHTQYAVFLNASCSGPANGRLDGWITWDRNKLGPKFYTFDEDTSHNCSSIYLQTGWWFNYVNDGGDECGAANLNGLRYTCGEKEYEYTGKYLSWGHLPIADAYMYLRPRDYPNYDDHHDDVTAAKPADVAAGDEPAS